MEIYNEIAQRESEPMTKRNEYNMNFNSYRYEENVNKPEQATVAETSYVLNNVRRKRFKGKLSLSPR